MVKHIIVLGVVCFFFCSTHILIGQIQYANPDSALQMILEGMEGSHLNLRDAVSQGLANATQVRAAEAVMLAAEGAARREAGQFDPELFFSFIRLDQDQPTASFFSGASVLSTTQSTASVGVRTELPIGTRLEAAVNTVRLETNSTFASLNPQNTAYGLLTLRQPLLGGFHLSARKQAVKTDRELDAAKARYDQQIMATSAEVERNFWDLYAAERDYAVQQLTRGQAEVFLQETELRARTGLIGPNQIANAKTFLAEQEILLLDREEQLDFISDQLASLIGARPDAPHRRFLAADNPPADLPIPDVDVLVLQAVENNLEIRAAQADVEAQRALSRAALWEALPSIDLVGSLGGNGLSGTPQDAIFGSDTIRTTRGGAFGSAVSDAVKRQFPSWSIGLELTVPIGLRSGLGERNRLDAETAIAEQRLIAQTRLLEELIRARSRELEHGKRRLSAAREGVDAAQEQVRIGLIEFQNGRSTAFELVRLGADFALAQQRYSQALVRSAKAAAALRLLTSGAYPGSSTP